MRVGGQNGEGVVRVLTNSFLLLWVLTSVPILVKIDQEMLPWECPQTNTHTDRLTDRRKPIFTALHGMRSSDENSVCPSVCPSVKRVHCDKTDPAWGLLWIGFRTLIWHRCVVFSKCLTQYLNFNCVQLSTAEQEQRPQLFICAASWASQLMGLYHEL